MRRSDIVNREEAQHAITGGELYLAGDYKQSVVYLREALKINPRSGRNHFMFALALDGLVQLADAVDEYKEALRLGYETTSVYHGLGGALLRLGRLDESVVASQQALSMGEDYKERALIYHNLGAAYLGKQKLDAAAEALRASLSLNPNYASAHMVLGHVYFNQEQFDAAIAQYDAALLLDPTLINARKARSIAYMGKKQFLKGVTEWFKPK